MRSLPYGRREFFAEPALRRDAAALLTGKDDIVSVKGIPESGDSEHFCDMRIYSGSGGAPYKALLKVSFEDPLREAASLEAARLLGDEAAYDAVAGKDFLLMERVTGSSSYGVSDFSPWAASLGAQMPYLEFLGYWDFRDSNLLLGEGKATFVDWGSGLTYMDPYNPKPRGRRPGKLAILGAILSGNLMGLLTPSFAPPWGQPEDLKGVFESYSEGADGTKRKILEAYNTREIRKELKEIVREPDGRSYFNLPVIEDFGGPTEARECARKRFRSAKALSEMERIAERWEDDL